VRDLRHADVGIGEHCLGGLDVVVREFRRAASRAAKPLVSTLVSSTRQETPSSARETVPTLFEFRDGAPGPAHDSRGRQINPASGHHFHEIAKAEFEPARSSTFGI
jgi:hypothetical protein